MSASTDNSGEQIWGVMAEFATVPKLIDAIEKVRKKGYTRVDAYTPFPSHDIIHALHLPPSKLPWIVLVGGILGACFGYGLQYWTSVIDYPINVGGRPLHSWPYFVPITFRVHDLVRGSRGGVRNVRPQPLADAVPRGVQQPGIPPWRRATRCSCASRPMIPSSIKKR